MDIDAIEFDGASRRPPLRTDQPQQSSFAGTGRPQDGGDLAAWNIEVDAIENGATAEGELQAAHAH